MQAIAERGIEVLVPPDGTMREGNRPGRENGFYETKRCKLKTTRGRRLQSADAAVLDRSRCATRNAGRAAYAARPAMPRPCRSRQASRRCRAPRPRALGMSARAQGYMATECFDGPHIPIYCHCVVVLSNRYPGQPRDSHS